MNDKLENHYSGDISWVQFVAVFSDNWRDCGFKDKLTAELDGQVDVAMVCFARFPAHVLEVINERSPSLGGYSIRECCVHKPLINRVREMLMRMP